MKKKKSKKKLFIILAIVLVVLIYIFISVKNALTVTNVSDIFDYNVYTVKEQDMSEYLSLNGTVSSDDVETITADITGAKILDVKVELGSTVTKGETLVTLDVSEEKKQLETLKKEEKEEHTKNEKIYNEAVSSKNTYIERNKDSLTLAETTLKGALALCNQEYYYEEDDYGNKVPYTPSEDKRTICKLEANKAYNEVKNAYDDQIAALDKNISEAKEAMDNSSYTDKIKEAESAIKKGTIQAPMSGTITSLNIKKGDILSNQNIGTIQAGKNFNVVVSIPESKILKMYEGMNASITTIATDDKVFSGTVTRIMNVATSTEGSEGSSLGYQAIITIDDDDTELLVGMSAKCKLFLSTTSGKALAVPYDAILKDDAGNNYVYKLVEDGTNYRIEYTNVEINKEGEYYTSISSGLAKNDKVLITEEEFQNGDTLDKDFLDEFTSGDNNG